MVALAKGHTARKLSAHDASTNRAHSANREPANTQTMKREDAATHSSTTKDYSQQNESERQRRARLHNPTMLSACAALVAGYAEGNAAVALPRQWWKPALSWASNSGVGPCTFREQPGAALARLHVALPASATELHAAELCVHYTVRSDKATNWWFVAPPAASAQQRACTPTRQGSVTTTISFPIDLPLGYSRIAVVLSQPKESTTPLVPPLEALVAVVKRQVPAAPAWLQSSATLEDGLTDAETAALGESYRIVREDERAEKEEYSRRVASGRAQYVPLHTWEQAPRATVDALRPLLSLSLLRVLDKASGEPPSPADLWELVETPLHPHPVHRLRLFSEQGAERLASELDHAHAVATAVAPTNNASEGRDGRLPSDGPPSMLLDEVGLHAVAHALASVVLAPLSRLLYPEWTHGGQLDSYHAFTIHRRSAALDQASWFRPSSNSESGSGGGRQRSGSADDGVNASSTARAGVHSDVCEVSLNVALRTSDDLVGSRVGFEPGCCGMGPNATVDVLWLEHDVGTAFINLCQQRHGVDPLMRGNRDTLVVHGFASKFRRAPAEGWYEQCISGAGDGVSGTPQSQPSKEEL